MAKEIKLKNGSSFTIDDEDFEKVNKYRWYLSGNGAIISSPEQGGTQILTRFLLNVTDPLILIDHKDQNKLNNQKENLRISDKSLNGANRPGKWKDRYKGVYWRADRNTWTAAITYLRKKKCLGCFNNPEDAARAYDKAAKRYFGEFACLNFPEK